MVTRQAGQFNLLHSREIELNFLGKEVLEIRMLVIRSRKSYQNYE